MISTENVDEWLASFREALNERFQAERGDLEKRLRAVETAVKEIRDQLNSLLQGQRTE
jgi:hypothetical protein